MKNTVLVTGINGYIGQYLAFTRPANLNLNGTIRNSAANSNPILSGLPLINFNIEQEPDKYLGKLNPSILIHTAAMANLAKCERDPVRAMQINAQATARLAHWCFEKGIRMIYLSTDIVFSGEKPPYDENSQPDPVNAYGRSKFAGERAVSDQLTNYAIVRVSLALGRGLWQKQNFMDWIFDRFESGKEVTLFDDEIRTPTAIFDLVKLIWKIALSEETGIFHLCSSKSINRYELGKQICDKIGWGHRQLKPIHSADIKDYPRPADVSLKSTRPFNGKDLTMPAIDLMLDSILKKFI
jgi:dTDP-4-dehydrorhamnose reductase